VILAGTPPLPITRDGHMPPSRPDHSDLPSPVFVDGTGRRRRRAVAAGAAAGAALLASLIILLAGFFAGAPVPLPGWPDGPPPRHRKAGEELGSAPTAGPTPAGPPAERPVDPVPPTMLAPVVVPTPAPTSATPSVIDLPGRGDERRATPHGPKPAKSPRKPK
jgi:hypothetical protein